MTEQAMTTTYNLKLGVLRRFVRIVGAAFVAGAVCLERCLPPRAPKSTSSGRNCSARRAWPWSRARWRPWTRPCGRGSGPGWG